MSYQSFRKLIAYFLSQRPAFRPLRKSKSATSILNQHQLCVWSSTKRQMPPPDTIPILIHNMAFRRQRERRQKTSAPPSRLPLNSRLHRRSSGSWIGSRVSEPRPLRVPPNAGLLPIFLPSQTAVVRCQAMRAGHPRMNYSLAGNCNDELAPALWRGRGYL
jgi:hypothetical protein